MDAGDGTTVRVYTDLILHKNLEWKLSSFFRCIGQKKPGERLQMDWSKVVGSRGRARFNVRHYTDRWGERVEINEVKCFLDYNPRFFFNEDAAALEAAVNGNT